METTKGLNNSADKMIAEISTVITNALQSTPKYIGAIVNRVNEDGTVNVYLPPDNDNIFTNISNQTPFNLSPGDSVELICKDGTFTNCWIIAKHKSTMDLQKVIKETVEQVLREHNLV